MSINMKNKREVTLNTDYKNIIIIKYQKDLNQSIQTLIRNLKIPNKNVVMEKANVTKNKEEVIKLDEKSKKFIREHFIEDYRLIETINTNPQLFKMVI